MNLLRVRDIFHRISAVPAEERAQLLDDLCGDEAALRAEVEALLSADARAGAFLAGPTMRLESGDSGGEAMPVAIGAYRLLERLGEGGYGEVFLAEQSEPVRRRVALKMLKAGLDTKQVLARFEAERQTPAMMDHPGIARIFDAGTTPQGRPYFVMEFVDGAPVTEFCLLRKVPPRERLALFCEVCRAVQHAHARGVIHRDLKPPNILVSEADGQPRAVVIDFGISKAMRGMDAGATLHTGLRQLMGTPAYMSPEQAGLGGPEVDTRSDIYSLGVLLYELLTGVTPFDASQLQAAALAEVQRRISEEVPAKPSTRVASLTASNAQTGLRADFAAPVRLLKGDLDWIVMKALEKEPGRRYATAAAFAEDIVRHLSHEPVSAGPPSTFYRLKKWTRRHRAGAAAAAIALLAAGVALGGLIYGYVVAQREIAARKIQAERAESLLKLQAQIFETSNPESARGADYTVRELLNDFSVQFKQNLGVEPDVEISLRQTIGRAFQALARGKQNQTDKIADLEKSDLQTAEDHFRAALALAEKAHGAENLEAAGCRHDLGWVLRDQGRYQEARTELERALHIREQQAGSSDPLTLASRAFFADVLLHLNEPDKALAAARASVHWPDAGAEAIHPLQVAAQVCMERGDLAAAAQAAARALELAQQADGGTEAARCILPLQTLAAIRLKENHADEAAALAQRACSIAERIFGAEHRQTLSAKAVLNDIHRAGTTAADATQERQGIFDTLRKTLGEEHPETFNNFVDLLGSVIQSNPDGARDFVFKLMGASLADRDAGNPVPAEGMNDFARRVMARGNIGDYEAVAAKALEIVSKGFGESHRNTIDVERALGYIYLQQKRYPDAAALYRRSFEKCATAFGANHALTCEGALLEAQAWQSAGRFGDMEKVLTGLRERILSRQPENAGVASQLAWLASLYALDRRWAESAAITAEVTVVLRHIQAAPDKLSAALNSEATARRALGQMDQYVSLARESFECAHGKFGENHEQTWSSALRYAAALQSGLHWREGIPLTENFLRRASAALPSGHAVINSLRAMEKRLAANAAAQSKRAAQAEADWKKTAADSGAGSADALEKLRQLALMQGNAGDYPAVRRSLEAYAKGVAALPDLTPPAKDDPAVLSAWFDHFFADAPAVAEDERTIVSALERIPAEDAASPATDRLLQRAMTVFRSRDRAGDYFRLVESLDDRAAGTVWPAEQIKMPVPRGSIWTWALPPELPKDPAWFTDPAFDDNSWRRGASGFGGFNSLGASGITAPEKFDSVQPLLFRQVFTLPDGASFEKLKLRLRTLDGAIVWINGHEVLSHNITYGPAGCTATEPLVSTRLAPLLLDATLLRPGANLLAVAIFQAPARTSLAAFCFDAELEAR